MFSANTTEAGRRFQGSHHVPCTALNSSTEHVHNQRTVHISRTAVVSRTAVHELYDLVRSICSQSGQIIHCRSMWRALDCSRDQLTPSLSSWRLKTSRKTRTPWAIMTSVDVMYVGGRPAWQGKWLSLSLGTRGSVFAILAGTFGWHRGDVNTSRGSGSEGVNTWSNWVDLFQVSPVVRCEQWNWKACSCSVNETWRCKRVFY